MQTELGRDKRFTCTILPWLVFAGGLALYLATLNSWLSQNNLFQAAKSTGWLNGTQAGITAYRPVYVLLTWPLHFVPARWVPLALNLLSAVCGAASLGLLARTVALLPHDRTHDQREREPGEFALLSLRTAWLPGVLAALVFALQLGSWDNATTGTSDTLDLLMLAYVVRCLLEFRISERDSWLVRAAAVTGVALTNNWLAILLLPAFFVALIWLKRLAFFAPRFLAQVTLWLLGCAVCFYLVLPTAHAFSSDAAHTFWQILKMNLGTQKYILQMLVQRVPGNILLLLALTSLLPVLLISIKWASYFGDPSRVGIMVTTMILHLAHLALFGVCLWTAFDPAFSPRRIGFPYPALSYAAALSIGYFAGYFLLAFRPLKVNRMQNKPAFQVVLHRISEGLVWAMLLLVPAGLVFKNLPQIQLTNGPALQDYAAALAEKLPARAGVFSDDTRKLLLLEAWAERHDQARNYVFLDTQSLPEPDYHRALQRRYPGVFPVVTTDQQTQRVEELTLMKAAARLSEKVPLYYLHPSFGYYFEVFCAQPSGLVFELQRYPTNSLICPPLTEEELAAGEKFWSDRDAALEHLEPFINAPPPGQHLGFREWLMKKLHVPFEPNATAALIGNLYSQTLNAWGGRMLMAGKLKEAGAHFERALALYPDNAAARINLGFDNALQAGQPATIQPPRSMEDEFGKYHNFQEVLRDSGSFYDATHCFGLGIVYSQGGLYRQAAQQFERVRALVPDNLPVRLWLARLEIMGQLPDRALEVIGEIKARPDALESSGINKLDLLQIESIALFAAGQTNQADRLLGNALDLSPNDPNTLGLVLKISSTFKCFTNALRAVEHQLLLNTNDTVALVNQGYLRIQNGEFAEAIPPLTRALALETNNYTAQLNRAIAYLSSGQLDEARGDYAALEKVYPKAYQVDYGLADVAWRKQETNNAVHYYELYLANAPTNSDESKTISERLNHLKSGAP